MAQNDYTDVELRSMPLNQLMALIEQDVRANEDLWNQGVIGMKCYAPFQGFVSAFRKVFDRARYMQEVETALRARIASRKRLMRKLCILKSRITLYSSAFEIHEHPLGVPL